MMGKKALVIDRVSEMFVQTSSETHGVRSFNKQY